MATKDPIEPVIEEVEVIEPPVETPPEEPETPVEEVEDPLEVPEEETEEPKVSRREQLRVQDLLSKGVPEPKPTPAVIEGLDYSAALDADPELIKRLEADRTAAVTAAREESNAQLQSYRWETFLNIDAPAIEQKYSQLDKTSDDFHPALANAINTMYLSASGYDAKTGKVQNPNIRYAPYVESIFELADEIAGVKVETSTKNIKKQAAQTGIRPGGGSSKRLNLSQSPNAMSDEELKAKIDSDFKALGLA